MIPAGSPTSALGTFTILCVLLCSFSPSRAQTITVAPAEIIEGDVATVTIEYRSPILSLFQLQTDSLNENFRVLDVKPSVHRDPDPGSSMNIMRWQIALTPRKTGTLLIAPIPVREQLTPERSINVIPRAQSIAATELIEVRSHAEPAHALPGEQIIVTTQILQNRPMPGYRLSENETSIADRFMRNTTKTPNAPTSQRRTRRMAIFIDKPGTFTIPAATLRAEIENLDASGVVLSGQPTRSVYRRSAPVTITIDAPPEPLQATHWLPATNLEIEHQWESTATTLRAGDSLASTLTITARGLMAEALPTDILTHNNTQFSLFADSAERQDRFDGKQVTAQLSQRYVLVLNSHGEIHIPPSRLQWWDVNEKRARVETIPGRTLTVLPMRVPDARATETGHSAGGLAIAAAALTATLLAALAWWRSRRTDRFRLRKLRKACRNANAQTARAQLIYWAQENSHYTVSGLRGVAGMCSPALQAEILKLDRALYAASTTTWTGDALWRQFNRDDGKPLPVATLPEHKLPDLYPQ